MRIVFLGSADFGIPALTMLLHRHEVAAVVTTPPRCAGRGLRLNTSPIETYARSAGIGTILTPEALADPQFLETLGAIKADGFVVVAFRLLPRILFSLPRFGTLNIHASLLPAFRGPAPIQRAIESGATVSGVTVFRIDDGIDTGEILRQVETPVGAEETTPQLYERLSVLGAEALEAVLNDLEKGTSLPVVQRHELAGKAPKLKKEEGRIDWKCDAKTIFNRIRAFKPFPGTYTVINGHRLCIEWAHPLSIGNSGLPEGTVLAADNSRFEVQTGNGALGIVTVRPEGRRSMTAGEYLRGTTIKKGSRLDE